jgi:hypothetical protein
MITLDRQAITDLCMGATVLGTGGGGSPELGIALMEAALDAGKPMRLVSADEVPADGLVVMPAFVGSIAPGAKDDRYSRAMREQILTPESPLLLGLRLLRSRRCWAPWRGSRSSTGIPSVGPSQSWRWDPTRYTASRWPPWRSAMCGGTVLW